MKFIAIATIAFGLVFSLFGCGRPASPADSIALGQTHACADAGAWDGLECAKPHHQADDAPVDQPPPNKHATHKPTAMPPPSQMGECNCEPDDPLCSCIDE